MTQSELIYNAWLNTKKPIIYTTKDELKEIEFANPEKNNFFDLNFKGICNMCGKNITDGGIPVKKFFSAKYMDYGIHKCPSSTHICKSCAFCLGMNPNGRITLFRYPLVANLENMFLCNRKMFRDFLINPPEPPFIMLFPTSQKKHLFAKSKISFSNENFFVNLEEIIIPVNKSIKSLIEIVEALRGIGLNIDNIKNGIVSAKIIKNYDFKSQEKILNLMQDISKNNMLDLVLNIAQIQEKEDAECYLDLTQKI